MAKIGTTFYLNDRLTSGLKTIERQVNKTKQSADQTNVAFNNISNSISITALQQNNLNSAMEKGEKKAENLAGTLKKFVSAAAGIAASTAALKEFVSTADELVSVEARLAGIVDETNTLEGLTQKVYDSAQRSRGEYASTAQFIARVGQMASDLFTNDELIKFSETINKQMAINGTSTTEASAAMIQLSQALGSGVLRGEELNSVFEQAPGIIKLIAQYLDTDIGQIRSMASEGLLTAEVVKNAVLAGADQVDAAFEEMPMTWAQTWQSFTNQISWAIKPLVSLWSDFLNSEGFQNAISKCVTTFTIFVNVVSAGMNAIKSWAAEHKQILHRLAIIIGVTLTVAFSLLAAQAVKAGAILISTAAKALAAFVAANSVVVAQLTAVIAVIAMIVLAADECGVSVREVFVKLGGVLGGVANTIKTAFQNAWEFVSTTAHNAVEKIKSDFINGIAEIINTFDVMGISELIDSKFGTSLSTMSYTPNYTSYDYTSLADAYDTGAAYGTYYANKFANWVSDGYQSIVGLVDRASNALTVGDIADADSVLGTSTDDSATETAEDTKDAAEQTAENTATLADQVKKIGYSSELLVQLARTSAMQRIEQNIKLDISAPISGTTKSDVDGFVSDLVTQLETELKNSKRSIASFVGV